MKELFFVSIAMVHTSKTYRVSQKFGNDQIFRKGCILEKKFLEPKLHGLKWAIRWDNKNLGPGPMLSLTGSKLIF